LKEVMSDAGDLTIRKAVPTDARGVAALMQAAYSPYLSRLDGPLPPLEADYAEEVGAHQAWVMEEAGVIIGALFLDAADDHMVLVNVAVSPDQQGRGLGRRLIGKAEQETRAQGIRELRLFTHAKATENVILYTRLGWRE
jgi:N-acetylglutamate synthase-like GNAT family acetyltransferase